MRSNKKGFTLIELLAVIVILAIIALIATPIVLNVISKVRVSAAADSVYGAMDALTLRYGTEMLDPDGGLSFPITVDFATAKITHGTANTPVTDPLVTKGKLPTEGTLSLADTGKFTGTGIKVGTITCNVEADGTTVTCS